MNTEEVVSEIYNDLPCIKRKIESLQPKVRRLALKSKSKRYRQFVNYKSNRLNTWLLYFDYNKKDPTFLMLVIYITGKGYNAVMVNSGFTLSFSHYSGHFLERYNERYLKHEDLTKTEIFKKYIVRNTAVHLYTPDSNDQFLGRTNDGIVLGESLVANGYLWTNFKTFITPEMIHEGQTEKFDVSSKLFKDYWNDEWGKTKFEAFNPNSA